METHGFELSDSPEVQPLHHSDYPASDIIYALCTLFMKCVIIYFSPHLLQQVTKQAELAVTQNCILKCLEHS